MTEGTKIRVGLDYTRNLGNYENLKISIAVEDTKRDGETIDSATERVYSFVEGKLEEKLLELAKDLQGRK